MTTLTASTNRRLPEKSDIPSGYRTTDIGVLPRDWDVVEIGDLNPFVTSGSRGWARFYSDTGSLFVRITNLSREQISLDLEDVRFVDLSSEAMVEAARTHLEEGDILISITADIGIIGYVDSWVSMPAYMNQHIALIRFDPSTICGRYVAYSLASERPQRLFLASMDVGAKAGMSLITVRKIRFPLPPLPEQRAIAAALSDVDELIGALDKLIAKKRAIKLATMQQLLTGKIRLPGFRGEWQPRKVGTMLSFLPTANNPRKDLSGEGDLGYIHYGDVHAHATPILDYTKSSLPKISRSRVGNAVELQDGDLVFVDASEDMVGVGKSVEIANLNGRPVVAGLHTIACRGGNECWAPGFKAYLQFIPAFKQTLERVATGISVYAISKRQIGDVELALPDVPEQAEITTILSDMDTEIAAIEKRRDKTKAIKQGMMQSLLTGRVRLVKPEGTL